MRRQAEDLFDDYQRTGRLDLLNAAIESFYDEITATQPDHPDYTTGLANLGVALHTRFLQIGNRSDLDTAITIMRAVADATSPGHPDHAVCRSHLAWVLTTRFNQTGHLPDLDQAITYVRAAVDATPPDHPHHPEYLSNLGVALRIRFQRTGPRADLDEAVTAGRAAIAAAPDHPAYLSNLGAALETRFGSTGRLADLDEAITAARAAVATAPDHPNHPIRLSHLGTALQIRFEYAGHLPDSDEAIAALRAAVAATPPGRLDHPSYQGHLGVALWIRFQHTRRPSDLDDAITAARAAVAATPSDDTLRPWYLTSLGDVLRSQFERTGRLSDLDEAISVGRAAVAAAPDHPKYVAHLGTSLYARFKRTEHLDDLENAITALRAAVATPAADHAAHLGMLGLALHSRFEHTGHVPDLDDAITAFTDAMGTESASPWDRIRIGLGWGAVAVQAGRVDSAADGYAASVELLPLVAWHGLPRATRERHLAEYSALAVNAAACAIRAGRPERAVELLEAGRSVLWTQILNLRTDLADLAQQRPGLAADLDKVRTALDAPLPATPAAAISASADDRIEQLRAAQNRALENRMRLARDFDDLLTQVRALDGFEHFLTPTPFARLRAAATGGPVVIVNCSPDGCHALVLTTTGVQVVDLPELTYDQASHQAGTLLGVLAQPLLDRDKDRQAVFDILSWLWDTVTEPVLKSLDRTSPPASNKSWPRIWWCPTGPLTLLPLHAAGHHHRDQGSDNPATTDTVLDRVISSYTPTLTALLRAHPAPAPTGAPQLLAVGMPTTPNASDLPKVIDELNRIQDRYPITTRLQSPSPDHRHDPPPDPDTQPTTEKVLDNLRRHAWVHLSCHGSQHFIDPTESAFWLTDGPLRIIDLIEQPNPGPRELAFLSACQTATGSLRSLDEAIHLAAAMRLLGYRHVIATLWSIYDSPAPDVADTVYAALTATGTPDADHAAHALHRAVTALRAEYPTEPLAWAPYLHIGP